MDLISALKSGKPFRRKGWVHSLSPRGTHTYTMSDILADDWEIQGESKYNETAITALDKNLMDAISALNKMRWNLSNIEHPPADWKPE